MRIFFFTILNIMLCAVPILIHSVHAEKLSSIESRLMTDMFFVGEFADILIDSGIYSSLIIVSADDSRSHLREKLILWIQSNPHKAAKLYRAGKSPDSRKKYSTKLNVWRLNKHFLKLSEELKLGVNRENLADEDLSYISRRLFEGRQKVEKGMYAGDFGNGQSAGGGNHIIPALDWRLDSKGISKERKTMSKWLDGLRNKLNFDKALAIKQITGINITAEKLLADKKLRKKILSRKINGKTISELIKSKFAERDGLIIKAATAEREFIAYISRFIRRKQAEEKEAHQLGKLRKLLRLILAESHVSAHEYDIERKQKQMSEIIKSGLLGLPNEFHEEYLYSGKLLLEECSEILKQYKEIPKMIKSGASLDDVFNKMSAVQRQQNIWCVKRLMYIKLPEMTFISAGLGSSTVLYRVFADVFNVVYPQSQYSKSLDALAVYEEAVYEGLKAVAEGEYDKALWLFGQIDGRGNAKRGIFYVDEQLHYCVQTIKKARINVEAIQMMFFEGPFYRIIKRGSGADF